MHHQPAAAGPAQPHSKCSRTTRSHLIPGSVQCRRGYLIFTPLNILGKDVESDGSPCRFYPAHSSQSWIKVKPWWMNAKKKSSINLYRSSGLDPQVTCPVLNIRDTSSLPVHAELFQATCWVGLRPGAIHCKLRARNIHAVVDCFISKPQSNVKMCTGGKVNKVRFRLFFKKYLPPSLPPHTFLVNCPCRIPSYWLCTTDKSRCFLSDSAWRLSGIFDTKRHTNTH